MSKTNRHVKLTKHASQRALERNITREKIAFVINNPIETIYDSERGNYKSFAQVRYPHKSQETYLMVIHTKLNTAVTVISTMWQTTGGLRRVGFSKV